MLHGLGADCTQWLSIGIAEAADRLITGGAMPPMVVVMPSGEDGYWMNHRGGGPAWRDYLIKEFIPTIERENPIIDARREARAIGGLSAGGHGAMLSFWKYPAMFSVVGAHSPGLRDEATAFPFMGRGAEFAERDPFAFARQAAPADADLWLDTADGDPWRRRAEQLHQILLDRGVDHTWRSGPGGHDGAYWRSNLDGYLRFYATSLENRRVRTDTALNVIAAHDPSLAPARGR
jgi:enterochelin esterase-like enzyme